MKEENNIIYIEKATDLLDLKDFGENETVYIVLEKDIDMKGIDFKPIMAPTKTIILYGNTFKIKNLTIDNKSYSKNGLFGEVNNIYATGIEFENAYVKGGLFSSILAGKVKLLAYVANSSFNGVVESEAYSGGVIGSCDELLAKNVLVDAKVSGYDVVGGLVGMTTEMNISDVKIEQKPVAVGRAVSKDAGYCSVRESERINKMLIEALEHEQIRCSNSEMRILERMCKKNK